MKPNHPSRRRGPALAVMLVAGTLVLSGAAVRAQQGLAPDTEPPWPPEVEATLRSFFERVDVEAVMEGLARPPAAQPPAIGDGWEGPFQWVQQAVAFEPYHGSLRGAEGTRIALSGNALDQALLLRSLLDARGARTRLVRGHLSWEDAARLVGPAERALRSGDPWLRLVELTADHWWVEVDAGGRWTALDPSFPDSGPGRIRGVRGQVHDEPPAGLRAVVELSARVDGVSVLALNLPIDEIPGGALWVAARAAPMDAEAAEEATAGSTDTPMGPEGADPTLSEDEAAVPVAEPDPIAMALPTMPDGDLVMTVGAAGASLGEFRVSPLDLPRLELGVRVVPPLGVTTAIVVPWEGGPWASVALFLGVGQGADAELRRAARDVHGLLARLAEAEVAAQAAYLARPETDPDARRPVPPLPLPGEEEIPEADEEADADLPLDPWVELHLEAIAAWQQFDALGTEAIARSLLAAVDRLVLPGRAWRPGVRLLAIRRVPAAPQVAGRLTVWADDPVVLRGEDAARLQAAHDLLYSALLGQVLHRVADRPPVSAFDVTLRTVGTGSRLNWWREAAQLPAGWPPAALDAARADLATGALVAGPAAPIAITDPPLLGWWSFAARTGLISGRVLSEPGVAQAAVAFGEPRDLLDLESTLASLATLHEAARFLAHAGDPDSGAIAELIPRACAATALVRDLMLAGAPEGWRDPAFEAFCLGR